MIDVRPAKEYAAGHIPGAASIPLEELEARLAELPEGAEIVAYCRGANCVLAHDAVRLLAARGRAARRLADGMLEWYLAGLPVATDVTALLYYCITALPPGPATPRRPGARRPRRRTG